MSSTRTKRGCADSLRTRHFVYTYIHIYMLQYISCNYDYLISSEANAVMALASYLNSALELYAAGKFARLIGLFILLAHFTRCEDSFFFVGLYTPYTVQIELDGRAHSLVFEVVQIQFP